MRSVNIKTISILSSIMVVFACANDNSEYGDNNAKEEIASESTAVHESPLLRIEHKNGLTIYHITPHISLSSKPIKNEFVELISSAAFTDVYGQIVGHYYDHHLDLPYVRNNKDRNVTGGFIVRPSIRPGTKEWDFYSDGYEAELDNAVRYHNVVSAFAQNIIIYRGVTQDPTWRNNDVFQYRALCEMNGELKIIESETRMPYNIFVEVLAALPVQNALYLDMGTYNYLWYDEDAGSNDASNVETSVEVRGVNYSRISNFLNVYIVD